jgi:hypothetical protein
VFRGKAQALVEGRRRGLVSSGGGHSLVRQEWPMTNFFPEHPRLPVLSMVNCENGAILYSVVTSKFLLPGNKRTCRIVSFTLELCRLCLPIIVLI